MAPQTRDLVREPAGFEAVGVQDRAIFWAELGLVGSPSLLARAGRVLQQGASLDAELSRALRLAEEHVTQRCLVLSRYTDGAIAARADGRMAPSPASSTSSTAPTFSIPSTPAAADRGTQGWKPLASELSLFDLKFKDTPKSVVAERLCNASALPCATWEYADHCDNFNDAESCENSDSDGGSTHTVTTLLLESVFEAQGCEGIVAPSAWNVWLPILGCRLAHFVWVLVLSGMALVLIVKASLTWWNSRGDGNAKLADNLLCRSGPMCELLVAANALSQVLVMCAVRKALAGKAWGKVVRLLIEKNYGDQLNLFARKALFMIPLAQAALYHDVYRGRIAGAFNAVFDVVVFVALAELTVVIMIVLSASTMSIFPLRDYLRDSSPSELDWRRCVRMYLEDVARIDDLWRQTGLADGVALALLSWLLYIVWEAVVLTISTAYTFKRFCALTAQVILFSLILFGPARISSFRHSTRHKIGSVTYLAASRPATRRDIVHKLAFLNTLQSCRCGVEISFIGMLTMKGVAPLARFLITAVPVCWGIAIRMESTLQRDNSSCAETSSPF